MYTRVETLYTREYSMRGFFRILPSSGLELPADRRLRVCRLVVLLQLMYNVASAQGCVVHYYLHPYKLSYVDAFVFVKLGVWWNSMLFLQALVLLLTLETIELFEAKLYARLPHETRDRPIPEQNEWSLPYVFPIALLAGLYVLEWIGVSIMLDWKAFHAVLDNVVFLILGTWGMSELRALMNRQRAYAAGSAAKFPLMIWLVVIPLMYYWIIQFADNLLYEMVGVAITAIIATASFLPHGEGIFLFMNTVQHSMTLEVYMVYLPVPWALLMIYKADHFGIGNALKLYSPLQKRLILASGIMLAFIWPALPRWVFPRLAGETRFAVWRWPTLIFGTAAVTIILLITGYLTGLFPSSYIGFYYPKWTYYRLTHYSLWICGAWYEVMRLNAIYKNS